MSVAHDHFSSRDNGTETNPQQTHASPGVATGVGIGVVWRDAQGDVTISSVTYGGNAVALEDSQVFNSNLMRVALYSLPNPPSGSQTYQVNFSSAPSHESAMFCISVTGGSLTDVFSNVAKATATTNAPTVNVVSAANEYVMDVLGAAGNIGNAGAGQTKRIEHILNGSEAACSTEAGSTSVTMSWALGGSGDWGLIAGSFKAATAAGGVSKNFFLRDSTVDGWLRLSESAEGSSVAISSGWIVDTGTTNHSELESGVERAAATFTGTTVPDGTLDATLHDALRTENQLTGNFAAGDWVFLAELSHVTSGGTHDGRIRFRLLRSANTDGSGATEITSGQQQGSIASDIGVSKSSFLIFTLGAFSVANEYLFVQLAWERTGAGGGATDDVHLQSGALFEGTNLQTTAFTSTSGIKRAAAHFLSHVAQSGGITNV